MLPILKKTENAHIVNLSSQAGLLRILPTNEKRAFFASPKLTQSQLEGAMRAFVDDVKGGSHRANGWPDTCYGMSKLAVTALSRVLARDQPDLIVNCCCPGYCKTDMSSQRGTKTAEEGARTPFMLAILGPGAVSGKFFVDEKEAEW